MSQSNAKNLYPLYVLLPYVVLAGAWLGNYGGNVKYANLMILFAIPAVISCLVSNRTAKLILGIAGEAPMIVFAVYYTAFLVQLFTSVWLDIIIVASAVVIAVVSFALTFVFAKKERSNVFFLVLGIIAFVSGICGIDVIQNIFHTFSFAMLFTGLGFIYAFIASSLAMIVKACLKSR